jgi:nitroreductase
MNRFRRLIFRVLSSSKRIAALGYALLSTRFDREMHAIAFARHRNLGNSGASRSDYALRRGIHRLEKGLVMQPRAAVFGLDYINDVLKRFAVAVRTPEHDQHELRWAHDVLARYFSVVADHPSLALARSQWGALAPKFTAGGAAPFPRAQLGDCPVGFDQFLALSQFRYSTRHFRTKSVDRCLVEQALTAAVEAPSACNRQPYRYLVYLSPTEAAEIASLAVGTAGYAENIPALVVLLGDFSAIEGERDRHVPYVDAALSAMQFMLALETLGLASCAINWPDIEPRERAMAKRLDLPPFLRPVMLIALGYPQVDAFVPFSQKKSIHLISRIFDGT